MLPIPPDLDRRTGPARGTAILGILLGALAPGILLWLAIAAIGRLLTGPLIGWNRSESALNRSLQDTRDRTGTRSRRSGPMWATPRSSSVSVL